MDSVGLSGVWQVSVFMCKGETGNEQACSIEGVGLMGKKGKKGAYFPGRDWPRFGVARRNAELVEHR